MKNISKGLVILAVFMLLGYACSLNIYNIQAIDLYVQNFFDATRSSDGIAVMKYITKMGEPVFLFPVVGVTLFAFFYFRKWKMGMILAIGSWMTDLCTGYTKELFNIQRPLDKLIGTGGFSFPSGHVTSVTIVFAMIAVGLVPLIKYQKLRVFCWTVCGLIITLVCISRLYLNVHWVTDVVGGILMPVGIIVLLIGAGQKIENMR